MTSIRKEAIEMLERVPEDKLSFVIQIMRGVNGLIGDVDNSEKNVINLDQFVMPSTERGQDADSYIRELRDNDTNDKQLRQEKELPCMTMDDLI